MPFRVEFRCAALHTQVFKVNVKLSANLSGIGIALVQVVHPEVAAVDGVPHVEVVLPEGLVDVLELLVWRARDPQTRPPARCVQNVLLRNLISLNVSYPFKKY